MANQTLDAAGSGGHTTFASALAAITLPADIIYVKSTSAENVATTTTYTNTVGTPEKPTRVISVNDFTSYTPTPGGGFGQTSSYLTTFVGNYSFYGFKYDYNGGSGTPAVQLGSTAGATNIETVGCSIGNTWTASTVPLRLGLIYGGATADVYKSKHTDLTLTFGHTSQRLGVGAGNHSIKNLILAGEAPTALVKGYSDGTGAAILQISDSDLSNTAVGSIFVGTSDVALHIKLNNVKLHASTTLMSGTLAFGNEITAVNCSSGDTAIQFAYYGYEGSVLSDSTVKASSSPLTNGVTEFSRKFTPTPTCGRGTPLTTDLILAVADNESIQPWIDVLIGADGASALDNSQLWIDVSACTVDGTTTGTVTSTRAVILATPIAHANSNTAYNGGYATPMTHKVQIPSAITVRQTGYVKITVNLAYTTNPVYLGKYGR